MLKMTQTPWGREHNTHSVLLFILHRLSKRTLRSSVWRAASRLWSAWLMMPTRGSRQTHTTKRWTTRRITRPKLPRWLRTSQHSKRNWQSWLQSTRRKNNHWERFGIYLHVWTHCYSTIHWQLKNKILPIQALQKYNYSLEINFRQCTEDYMCNHQRGTKKIHEIVVNWWNSIHSCAVLASCPGSVITIN